MWNTTAILVQAISFLIKTKANKKTEDYSSVFCLPTPKTQHGSVKPQQPKSYSYTEPKPKTNQYVSNSVNTNNTAKTYSYNSPKTHTYSQPKTYTYIPPKTNIGEYKTLGGYTNKNPYVTKDKVGNGQNSYSTQPKLQVKNDYTGAKNQLLLMNCGTGIIQRLRVQMELNSRKS